MASPNSLTRINMTTGDIVASAECDVEAFMVKANMVLVRGTKSIQLLHKTDLTPVKTFPISHAIINLETLATASVESEYCIDAKAIEMQDTIHVAAIPNNEAPKFKILDNPQSVTVHEGSDLTTNVSYTRNTKLSDQEGVSRVKLYIRNLQDIQDLITYKVNTFDKTATNFRFVAGCQREIEQDTVVYIDLEVIDEWGASTIASQIKINIRNTDLCTDVPSVDTRYPIPDTRKILRNGQILILHNGIYYDILGNIITFTR
jgi:hypothetical protein